MLYAENTYQYLGLLEGVRRNRIVATFHLPMWAHHEVIRSDRHLGGLSAAICVGRNQMDYFTGVLGADRTFFVPHGVDVEHFMPPADYVTPECAILVAPGDAAALAAAAVELLNDTARRQAMGLAARRQALAFAWPEIVPQLRAVYDAVA